jgi:hypothetical protein
MADWKIELHQRSILGGTHLFWALRNDRGDIEREFHGFATAPDGSVKSIGWPWQSDDHIGMYEISRKDLSRDSKFWHVLGENFDAEHIVEPHEVAFSGSKSDALARWQKGAGLASQINNAKIGYELINIFGRAENSNAVAFTFGEETGLRTPRLTDPRSGVTAFTPGWDNDLRNHLDQTRLRRKRLSRDNLIDIKKLEHGPRFHAEAACSAGTPQGAIRPVAQAHAAHRRRRLLSVRQSSPNGGVSRHG